MSSTIQLSTTGGNASLVIDGANTTVSAGALLAGDLTLYVDNSNGSFTADELARINDAISGVEALVSPYGTNIIQVDASIGTDANIVIDASDTSPVGGLADGVLGCTSDAGLVTLIRGWNWYAGADATAIGADQYDFSTVMTHEIGHALGLGHSTDGASVMYAMLASGSTRRTMTTPDLNVPDSDGGPTGLHAAIPFHNVAGALAANAPSPTGSNGVAVLDEVLSGWNQADTGFSKGIAHRVSGHGSNFVVQRS